MFEKVIEIGYLFDFYGKLLSTNQYSAIELYYIHDLSLKEIGDILNISRQGVFDTLKRAEKKLYNFEEKLGLVDKFNKNKIKTNEILNLVKSMKNSISNTKDNTIYDQLEKTEEILVDVLGTSQEGSV